jgi:EmrB/QacA subfamily drug resistance transporter
MSTVEHRAESPRAAGDRSYTHRQITVIMWGLALAMLLAALDQTIVATALTTISRDFHRPDLYSWVVTAYLLAATVTAPLYGKFSDLYGRKRIYQFAIVVFLIGSALSGLSQNMFQLIVFRGVQGLGAGGLISLTLAIVGDVIPPRDRGRYQGYFGGIFALSAVLGPLVGGFLVDQASWRWVFYVNVPIGVVALVVINRVLKLDHNPRKARIDLAGALLLVGGVSLVLVGVQNAGEKARFTGASLAFGVVGALLVIAFVFWERRAPEPILPMRMFRNPVFRISSTLSLVSGGVMLCAVVFMPQYFQIVRGVSPTVSGLHLLPLLGGLLLAGIVSGRMISRYGRYKVYAVVGTAMSALGIGLLALITVSTSYWVLSITLFVVGAGLGMFMQVLILATQNSIDRSDMGVGTAAIMFSRSLGGAIWASALGAILIAHERSVLPSYVATYGPSLGAKHAFTYGMTQAYLWALPVGLVCFGLSLFMPEQQLQRTVGGPAEISEPMF